MDLFFFCYQKPNRSIDTQKPSKPADDLDEDSNGDNNTINNKVKCNKNNNSSNISGNSGVSVIITNLSTTSTSVVMPVGQATGTTVAAEPTGDTLSTGHRSATNDFKASKNDSTMGASLAANDFISKFIYDSDYAHQNFKYADQSLKLEVNLILSFFRFLALTIRIGFYSEIPGCFFSTITLGNITATWPDAVYIQKYAICLIKSSRQPLVWPIIRKSIELSGKTNKFRFLWVFCCCCSSNVYKGVDASLFRRAVWIYIHSIYGITYDDYDYNHIKLLLKLPLRTFINTICTCPERITKKDYDTFMKEFSHSEKVSWESRVWAPCYWNFFNSFLCSFNKVHLNIVIMEARVQASITYFFRAIAEYYCRFQ